MKAKRPDTITISTILRPAQSRWIPRLVSAVLICIPCLLFTTSIHSQDFGLLGKSSEDAPKAELDPLTDQAITARLDALLAEKGELSRDVPATPEASSLRARQDRKLEQVEQLLRAQLSAAENLQETEEASEAPEVAPLPSIPELNSLYERLDAMRAALAGSLENLRNMEERLSQITSSAGGKPGSGDDATPDLAGLDVRIAQEEVNLARIQVRNARASAKHSDALKDEIQRQRLAISGSSSSSVDFPDVFATRIARLVRQERQRALKQETTQLLIDSAQRRVSADANDNNLAELRVLTALQEINREAAALYASELERLETQKNVWVNWAAVLQGAHTREDLHQWLELAKKRLDSLQIEKVQAESRLTNLKSRTSAVESQVMRLASDTATRRFYEEALDENAGLQSDLIKAVSGIEYDQRLTQRFLTDLEEKLGRFNLSEWIRKTRQSVSSIWAYEITAIDDSPLTVGSLTVGLVLFGLGLFLARRISRLVGSLASNRLKLDVGASQALQTLSFYVMLAAVILLALQAIHFPLTAFAFLGGALAIGLGFGSQNVMNNFISGLILMLERPVRAADVVEVDGNYGTIEGIGARSTQIRSTDGRHIVVPNSFFLENNVINWTLSDELVRTKVSVGVAYGSPTEQVSQLIEEVVNNQRSVLKNPAPVVIFSDFGDSSLVFDAHFWVTARSPMGMKQVESQVRHAIDAIFRENGIVIAFPQQDVHFDEDAPLRVEVISDTRKGGAD